MKGKFDFSGLTEPVAKKLSRYLYNLTTIIGKNLDAIVLYGSAATEEFDPRRSNINLIVVVEKLDLELLHKVQPLVKKGARSGIVAPLFLTHEHMDTSSDVFPIEFLDMSDFHHTIYGDDPFKKFKIGTEHLRLECEEKLKGSLINLRQSYLEVADRRGPMMELVSSSITGVVSIFRGLIRLAGHDAPASKQAVIMRAAELYPVEPKSFLTALTIKHEAPRMSREETDDFFSDYLVDIEKLALHVDKMGKSKPRKKPAKKAVKKPVKKPAAKPKKTARKPARGRKSK